MNPSMNRKGEISATNLCVAGLAALGLAAAAAVVLRTDIFGRKGSGLPGTFSEDANYRQVRPADVLYEEQADARIATGFAEARGLALGADGRVLVAGDKAVKVFDESGKLLREFPAGGEVRCLAVAADGTLLLGVNDHVEGFDPNGARRFSWPAPKDDSTITCVTPWKDDVLAAFYRKRAGFVVRYDRGGNRLNEIVPPEEEGVRAFRTPSAHLDVAVTADEVVWVGNTGKCRVEAYTLAGQAVPDLTWGRPSGVLIEGFAPCCNPTDLAVLPGGGFVTAEKGPARVKVYDAKGVFQGVVAPPDAFASNAAGLDVAADARGRIFVLDTAARAVRVFVRKKATASGPAGAQP
jgi:hypothetical protein